LDAINDDLCDFSKTNMEDEQWKFMQHVIKIQASM
jgi:hypothetical protein